MSYQLQDGPLKTLAIDGSEAGIYGGSFPMGAYKYWGQPNLPWVMRLDILNAVVAPDEKLRVRVKARAGK